MARILITCWPFVGHIYPQVALAHALRRRGHEVAFYTGDRGARLLEGEGFLRFPFKAVDEKALDELLFGQNRASSHPLGMTSFVGLLKSWLLDSVPGQLADLEPIIRDWAPDLISAEEQMWGPILVLHEKLEHPPVAITGFGAGMACLFPGPDAPPFGPGLPSPRTPMRKLASNVAKAASGLMAREIRRGASEIRQKHGLRPLETPVLTHFAKLPLYIVPSAPELDYQRRDLPANVHYTGPLVWNRPKAIENPEWLDSLRTDIPWVHASEGTVHVTEPFALRSTAQGLAGLPMEVLLTTGADRDPDKLDIGPRASNIHVARWISHSELLPKISVFVTTGGAGSAMTSLAMGVPLVCIPTEWDKPEVAQRVVESGAGLRLEPRQCTPANVRRAVERILGDSSFRTNARRIGDAFARLGGADRAAELLEQLTESRRPAAVG